MDQNKKNFSPVGTDIEEVKRLNAESGLSYNEVKNLLAQTGGKGTAIFSDTDIEEIKRQINPGIEE